jgi:hypothetical protein
MTARNEPKRRYFVEKHYHIAQPWYGSLRLLQGISKVVPRVERPYCGKLETWLCNRKSDALVVALGVLFVL